MSSPEEIVDERLARASTIPSVCRGADDHFHRLLARALAGPASA